MKRIISAMVVAGALVQAASAMGPTGDLTHRHFYKDQEWIWQKKQSQSNSSKQNETDKVSLFNAWYRHLAVLPPFHPPLACLPPFKPPMATDESTQSPLG